MKTSKEYYEEALKDLGGTYGVSIPMQAAAEIALIKAMKDFVEEYTKKDIEQEVYNAITSAFQFDHNGYLYVKEDKL